ncbi:hypothetical protein Patl1_03541 [Pistacia atlantica]|uniref:Uncharacterized protein n=1 Tax=Pistacia atlantica TaxID=434234 RepID=A0ACC1C5T0_9ROSI|nr:hypothetical protein Patl1_03541 [Pistacia atlantica]
MNSTSPANSSISTTAIVGGGGGGGGGGGSSSNNTVIDDFHFPSDLISIQDRKDEAMLVLKSDLLAALNKEVKSMDEDNWMFEGPRSRINLISKGDDAIQHFQKLAEWDRDREGHWLYLGGHLNKQMETTKSPNLAPPPK